MINPRIGHDENDRPYPYLVRCNGAPFGGFPTSALAEAARKMWQDQPRPGSGKGASFTVERVT